MRKRAANRRYSTAFKVQVCTAIRAGTIGWREAQRTHGLSGGLLPMWLRKFDAGEYAPGADPERRVIEELQGHVAELERLVGRLTLENERLRIAARTTPACNDNDGADKAAPGNGTS
jgi:transposase-like protein